MPPTSRQEPPVPTVQRSRGSVQPDQLIVRSPGLTQEQAHRLAITAARRAQAMAPKVSGRGARGIRPVFGAGFFGVSWANSYMGFQESGSRPFTMRSLAGKVIPMWINDPTGSVRRQNPKAATRITQDGRRQTRIFRKVSRIGERKNVIRNGQRTTVPASYPGAPGRIAYREVTEYGGVGGRIAKMTPRAQSTVRWRHPGLLGRHFMHQALSSVAMDAGLGRPAIQATFRMR